MNASIGVLNDKQGIKLCGFLSQQIQQTDQNYNNLLNPIVFSVKVCMCVCVHLQGSQLAKSRRVPVYKLSSQSQFPEGDRQRHTHMHRPGRTGHYCFITSVCVGVYMCPERVCVDCCCWCTYASLSLLLSPSAPVYLFSVILLPPSFSHSPHPCLPLYSFVSYPFLPSPTLFSQHSSHEIESI